MKVCEILIVEDSTTTVESWKRDIRDFNRAEGAPFQYCATYAVTKKDALRVLERMRIDCAVIDLRLPEGDDDGAVCQPLGNEVLQHVLEESGVPAVVYSGYESEVSDSVHASKIRIVTKEGGAARRILDSFVSQAGLMDAMGLVRSQIARETARIFNRSIWPRWEARWSSEGDRQLIAGIISRQTAAHIAEILALTPAKHHPEEFYLVPSLYADRLDTGDLLEHAEELLVVLTPKCNLAHKAPSQLMLALCRPMEEAWARWKTGLEGSQSKRDRALKELGAHATQGHEISTHFLPPLEGRGPWLVDFKEVRTLGVADLPAALVGRFASIAPQFVPNLVQRYAAYLGRIGQPDLGADLLAEVCKNSALAEEAQSAD